MESAHKLFLALHGIRSVAGHMLSQLYSVLQRPLKFAGPLAYLPSHMLDSCLHVPLGHVAEIPSPGLYMDYPQWPIVILHLAGFADT